MADRSVTVTGTGAVAAVPDVVMVSFAASARRDAVMEAFDVCNQTMSAMVDALRAAGVPASDMQTAYITLHEDFERRGGYEASQSLKAKLSGIEQARQLVPDVLAAGGDAARLHGISFAISNPAELVSQARELAMADARATAEHLASLVGASLGGVLRVREQRHGDAVMLAGGRQRAMKASMSMEPGTDEVTATVEVEWSLAG